MQMVQQMGHAQGGRLLVQSEEHGTQCGRNFKDDNTQNQYNFTLTIYDDIRDSEHDNHGSGTTNIYSTTEQSSTDYSIENCT